MKTRTTLCAIAAGAALVVMTTPAAAITSENSSPAPERTEVGFLGMAVDLNGDGEIDLIDGFCSGTMIDEDTFLTAAHCSDDFPSGLHFFVSLEEDILTKFIATSHLPAAQFIDLWVANGWMVEGDLNRHPMFRSIPGVPASDQHDIAVIDFADRDTTPADLWTFTPATLPSAGQLDAIGDRALDGYDWWVVGYGVQEALRAPGGLTYPPVLARRKAPQDFNALTEVGVRLAKNASRDLGGICYGDSGGPNFVEIEGTLILAAISLATDIPCYASTYAYRTDTPSARAFLADFVDLP
jgi:Trypsin